MKYLIRTIGLFLLLTLFNNANAFDRGIYITQSTAENKAQLQNLIEQSKKNGIKNIRETSSQLVSLMLGFGWSSAYSRLCTSES